MYAGLERPAVVHLVPLTHLLEGGLPKTKRDITPVLYLFSGMDELMEVSFSPLAATGKPLSRCGKCHRFMKYIQVCAA